MREDRLAILERLVVALKKMDAGYLLWKAQDEGYMEISTAEWYEKIEPLFRELGLRT